jgi:hypothetical protein
MITGTAAAFRANVTLVRVERTNVTFAGPI